MCTFEVEDLIRVRVFKKIDWIFRDENKELRSIIVQRDYEKFSKLPTGQSLLLAFMPQDIPLIEDLYHQMRSFAITEPVLVKETTAEEAELYINQQQDDNDLSSQEQATTIMNATASTTDSAKTVNRLKAKMIELSKVRNKQKAKEWWESLSRKEKAAIIASLNTILTIPAVWNMGWMWKGIILSGVGVGSFVLYDKIAELKESMDIEEVKETVRSQNDEQNLFDKAKAQFNSMKKVFDSSPEQKPVKAFDEEL